jgi:hypothetical protein
VEAIREGMQVWSIDAAGRRVVATVLRVGRTPVPATHEMVKLVLDDGRVLHASPGHPLADGRRLAAVRPGDLVDGAIVSSDTLEPYTDGWTFDLLPEGPPGTYLADGIPLRVDPPVAFGGATPPPACLRCVDAPGARTTSGGCYARGTGFNGLARFDRRKRA